MDEGEEVTKEHRIIREVRRLAAENPDFVYAPPMALYLNGEWAKGDACKYVHDGRGSCIFGQAMMNTGDITADVIEPLEGGGICDVCDTLQLGLRDEEMAWARIVQQAQDVGIPWGDAIAEADQLMELTS